MDKTTEKLFGLLRLLDNCRNKLQALYNLFNSCYLSAKGTSLKINQKFVEIMTNRDKLVEITNAITLSKKEDRDKAKRVAKPKIKEITSEVTRCKKDAEDFYTTFNTSLDGCVPLRAEYKNEVKLCCASYKTIVSGEKVQSSIEKGYKQQVKLIRAILDKINLIILSYNAEKDKVDEKYKSFKQIFGLVDTLAIKLAE